ncbi:MAG: hypothetical protein QM572_01010 [Nocardioides sp.]|uniref:hypothetical protein n=1 Tax=Nocardioides sp. TaxID=35761 RepID=UPI0039E3A790
MAVAMAACASDEGRPTTSPDSGTSSSTPTALTSAPTPSSDSEAASQAASELVERYYKAIDLTRQDPNVSLDELAPVATSVELSSLKSLVREAREKRETQTGETKIAHLQVQSVDLDNADPGAGNVPTVQIDVCWDVSNVDVIDANGKSVVASSRPDVGWTRLTVANYHYEADPASGWRVATSEDLKRSPCAES